MTGWFPLSSCTQACLDGPTAGAGPVARVRRWAGVTGALASAAVPGPARTGTAARALGALGIAVEVVPPAVRWADDGSGALLVANHVSWVDDVALLALFPASRPVAKAEIGEWPLVGRWAGRTGAVFLDRGALHSLPGTVAEVAGILSGGGSVLLHPEGTTACGSELGRFRPAFFQAAVDAGVPVRPIALRYRTETGGSTAVAGYFGEDSLRASLQRVVAARGLVLEVHLLPELAPGRDRRALAALAEYAVAEVTEGRPAAGGHPRAPRPRPRPGIDQPLGAVS